LQEPPRQQHTTSWNSNCTTHRHVLANISLQLNLRSSTHRDPALGFSSVHLSPRCVLPAGTLSTDGKMRCTQDSPLSSSFILRGKHTRKVVKAVVVWTSGIVDGWFLRLRYVSISQLHEARSVPAVSTLSIEPFLFKISRCKLPVQSTQPSSHPPSH